MITEDQFRQALSDIVAGLANPRAIIPQILIVVAYFAQKFNPFPTGYRDEATGGICAGVDSAAIDCGVEFRAFCNAIDCPCDDIQAAPVDENVSLAAGGLGAVIAIALAKRALAALAEKIEDPTVKAAIQALLQLIG